MNHFRSTLFILVILLSLAAVTIVFADDPPPPGVEPLEPRIVGGQDADVGEWPWQVRLSIFPGIGCGGTIISENWVLTAAHCVVQQQVVVPASWVTVIASMHKISVGGDQNVGVNAILVPSAHNVAAHGDFDFALLHLSSPIIYNSKVASIILATPDDAALFSANATVTATGWGLTSPGGSAPDTQQEAEMPIVSNSDCEQIWGTSTLITSNMLCVGSPNGGVGLCHGDSGGTVAAPDGKGGWIHVGIPSFVYLPCASPTFPDVMANVSAFSGLIQSTMTDFNASSSDLKIINTGSSASLQASSTITYTMTVTNQSSDVSTSTAVGDALAAGTTPISAVSTLGSCIIPNTAQVVCSLGNMNPGASATITIEAFVASTTQGSIVNTAAAWNKYSTFLQDAVVATVVTNVTTPPPPAVPGVTVWGIISLAIVLSVGVFWRIARARNRPVRTA